MRSSDVEARGIACAFKGGSANSAIAKTAMA
jgi:hypothetical protein